MGLKDLSARVSDAMSHAASTINAKVAQAANSRAGEAAKVAISSGKVMISTLEATTNNSGLNNASALLDVANVRIDMLRGDIEAAEQSLARLEQDASRGLDSPALAELTENTTELISTIQNTTADVSVDGPIVFTDATTDRGVTVQVARDGAMFSVDTDKAIEQAQIQLESTVQESENVYTAEGRVATIESWADIQAQSEEAWVARAESESEAVSAWAAEAENASLDFADEHANASLDFADVGAEAGADFASEGAEAGTGFCGAEAGGAEAGDSGGDGGE